MPQGQSLNNLTEALKHFSRPKEYPYTLRNKPDCTISRPRTRTSPAPSVRNPQNSLSSRLLDRLQVIRLNADIHHLATTSPALLLLLGAGGGRAVGVRLGVSC